MTVVGSPRFEKPLNNVSPSAGEGIKSGVGSLQARLSSSINDEGDKENSPSDRSVATISDRDSSTVYASVTLPRSSPEKKRLADSASVLASSAGVGGIKPPIKAKPQVAVKKPVSMPSSSEAGELWRKLNSTSGGHVGEVATHLQQK